MTTSGGTLFSSRLTRIDELTRGDHSFLEAGDECLFFGEYTARKDWSYSSTNRLVLNFKKPVTRRSFDDWRYKLQSSNIGRALGQLTLVPVPPSKLKIDPDYDDRMMDMLRALRAPAGINPDVRELVVQTKPMPAAHESAYRPLSDEWEKVYAIDEALAPREPTWIGIIDDVLVTGCKFRAMSNVLKRRFPVARITGLFIARRVLEIPGFSEVYEERGE